MKGSNIAGGKSDRGRAEDDFYATNPKDVKDFLNAYGEIKGSVLEPCIGAGHLAKVVYVDNPAVTISGYDIVDRKNRNFIGIELDKNYFEIAKKRIEE